MKKLLIFLKDYKKETVIAPLFKLLEASFELIVPLVMAAIINQGIASEDSSYIMKMCLVLVLLAVVGLVCSITAQYFAAKAAVGFSAKLRNALFKHIESLSFTELDTIGNSTLITRMTSDVNQVQSGVNMVLRLFLRSPFIVFGAMIMAFTVDVKAALIFVVTIPLLSIVVFGVMLISIPKFKQVQAALDKVLGKTRENLAGARVIRAFNRQEQEREEFRESNTLLMNLQLLVGKISALTNPATYIIINAATLAVIWVAGDEVFKGTISQGEVVALVNYMSQILVELVKLANLIVLITKSIACGNRIQEVFEVNPSMEKDISGKVEEIYGLDSSVAVEFDHVSVKYQGAAENSLSDVTFAAKKGQTIGIIGGTGSGKSTLVHLIPRFYDAFSGTVKINGKDVKEYPLTQIRQMVGIVMQKAVLFKGTIEENLRWGNEDATEEQLWAALETAQAKEVVEKKEGMLSYKIEQGGKNLSGGHRNRPQFACLHRRFDRHRTAGPSGGPRALQPRRDRKHD